MKVIGISGSPRKGNTEWMLNRLLERITENGAEAELVLLRKIDIKLCRGCLSCEEGGKNRKGVCKIQDDMNAIYPKLLKADCIVFATPAYFELVSGLLKKEQVMDFMSMAGKLCSVVFVVTHSGHHQDVPAVNNWLLMM